MSRHNLLAGILFSIIGMPCLIGNASADEPKPVNIFFAFADDWGQYASIYAQVDGPGGINDAVRTPNIDRIARDGVLFRNAFVTAPSCTPCRSSLLSGQYFWRTGRGAILRGAVWDASIPSFPLMLHEAGYHIGETYKVWSPGTPGDAPYGAGQYAYERAGGSMNQFSQNVTAAVARGEPLEAAKQKIYDQVVANFDAFLAARKPGQPFCYWFGPTNVHRKWIRGSGKALWNIDPDSLTGKLPPFLPDVHEVREDIADYLGEVQAFDAAVGQLLERLEEAGELQNTLIVISGDHGMPGFPNGKCNLYDFGTNVTLAACGPGIPGGRVVDDFVNLMDLAPTFLEAGGEQPAAEMTGRSLWSVLRSEKSGQVDPERSYVVTGRERHVDEARDEYRPYPQRALRTKDYLYIINFEPDRWPLGNPYLLDSADEPGAEALTEDTRITLRDMDAGPTKAWLVGHRHDPKWGSFYERAFGKRPREELYVLADDPYQVKNVAGEAQYAAVQKQLEAQLMEVLVGTEDPRVTGDRMTFERPPFTGPAQEGGRRRQRQR